MCADLGHIPIRAQSALDSATTDLNRAVRYAATARHRRHRISSTNCFEFPWRRSRRLTSHADVEFLLRRRRRILSPQFFDAVTE